MNPNDFEESQAKSRTLILHFSQPKFLKKLCERKINDTKSNLLKLEISTAK